MKRIIKISAISFGLLFIGAATVWAIYLTFLAPPPTPVPTTELPPGSIADEDVIDETPKTDIQKAAYTVPVEQPKNLRIPKINVYANVIPLGINTDGSLDSPKTAVDVGWFDKSALPDSPGATLIDGHVQGQGGPAVFTNLHKLAPGDRMTVERGDGRVFTYEVVLVEQKPIQEVDMKKLQQPINDGAQGLNLITCGGTYDYGQQTFDKRVLVYAQRV